MLLERATSLKAQINEFQQLSAETDKAEQFQTRATQFSRAAKRITSANEILSKFADASVSSNFVPNKGADYASKANSLRVTIAEDPSKIHEAPFNLKYDFVDRIIGIADAAERAVAKAWKTYVEKHANFESNDELNVLAEIPQFRARAAIIQRCRKEITALGNSLPTDPRSAKERLKELLANSNAAWNDISSEAIPPAVLSFIRACSNEGAPLLTYTEEVRSWLKNQNLTNSFRIRVG